VQLNLFLAVLKTKFAKAKNLLDEKRRQRTAMKAGRGSKKRNVLARATGWMKRECLHSWGLCIAAAAALSAPAMPQACTETVSMY
jgi:hypothetical protein